MARDYRPRHNKPRGFSGWLGLSLGLGLGLAVAAVIYLKDHRLDAPETHVGKAPKKRPHGNEAPEAGDPAAGSCRSRPHRHIEITRGREEQRRNCEQEN